jgi:transcriptional regulator with XRE-family HTH domain
MTTLEGNWIRQRRLAKGYTLTQVAEYVGISPAYLARCEINTARPSVRTLYLIATFLDEFEMAEQLEPFVPDVAPMIQAPQGETLF